MVGGRVFRVVAIMLGTVAEVSLARYSQNFERSCTQCLEAWHPGYSVDNKCRSEHREHQKAGRDGHQRWLPSYTTLGIGRALVGMLPLPINGAHAQ